MSARGREPQRRDVIVNLGGGVVIDMGGGVASAYIRGVPYVNGRRTGPERDGDGAQG